MADTRRPIPPNPPRWQPNPDPASIHVPGLDTTASVHDQIEQMEQLITIKLQNIDENFSKIHHLLANKILPAVKRYAVGTEPVRDAAKFWTSFYEQAAQIRIPTYDNDYSTVNELSSGRVHGDSRTREQSQHSQAINTANTQNDEPSIASNESSFLPGQAAFSSTPATARVTNTNTSFASRASDDPSWTASLESPLVRLEREFRNFSKEDDVNGPSTSHQIPSLRYDEPTPNTRQSEQPRSRQDKGKEASQSLLHSVLRHNLHSGNETSTSGPHLTNVSPLKVRGKPKTPIPKKFNPYLPPDIDPAKWSGLVDLSDPSIATPRRRHWSKPVTPAQESDDDDSFDGLPPGMSPPVMMSPARPPRSSAELGLLKLGQTPTKLASARITRDLVRDVQLRGGGELRGHGFSGTESSMSTMPTPPYLSRYRQDTSDSTAMDSSLESMMRRVGLDVPSSTGTASTPGLRLPSKPHIVTKGVMNSEPPMIPPDEPVTPAPNDAHPDEDSDSDFLDEINNTAHPSAAFLMASQGHPESNDSFGSSNHSSDSLNDEDANLGLAPIHPFARNVEGNEFDYDDSFDDDGYGENLAEFQEETVFGVPPAQEKLQAAGGDGLKILGEDLLQDTIGIGAQIARSGQVEESPTPASWAGPSRG